jgi:hypothetical protein
MCVLVHYMQAGLCDDVPCTFPWPTYVLWGKIKQFTRRQLNQQKRSRASVLITQYDTERYDLIRFVYWYTKCRLMKTSLVHFHELNMYYEEKPTNFQDVSCIFDLTNMSMADKTLVWRTLSRLHVSLDISFIWDLRILVLG